MYAQGATFQQSPRVVQRAIMLPGANDIAPTAAPEGNGRAIDYLGGSVLGACGHPTGAGPRVVRDGARSLFRVTAAHNLSRSDRLAMPSLGPLSDDDIRDDFSIQTPRRRHSALSADGPGDAVAQNLPRTDRIPSPHLSVDGGTHVAQETGGVVLARGRVTAHSPSKETHEIDSCLSTAHHRRPAVTCRPTRSGPLGADPCRANRAARCRGHRSSRRAEPAGSSRAGRPARQPRTGCAWITKPLVWVALEVPAALTLAGPQTSIVFAVQNMVTGVLGGQPHLARKLSAEALAEKSPPA